MPLGGSCVKKRGKGIWGGQDVGGGETLAPVEEVEGPWRQIRVAVSTVRSLGHGPPTIVTGVQCLPYWENSSVDKVLLLL